MQVPDGHKLLYLSIDGSRSFKDKNGNALPAEEAMIFVEDAYDIPPRSNWPDHDASSHTVDAPHELVDDEELEQDLLASYQPAISFKAVCLKVPLTDSIVSWMN